MRMKTILGALLVPFLAAMSMELSRGSAAAAEKRNDGDIQAAVKRHLVTDEAIRPYDVGVKAQEGIVTLSGVVQTSAAFERATQMAIAAGAKMVHNRLLIRNVTAGD